MVSVIVPVYNSEHTIGKCIESILSQTFSAVELVLINDGSTDKSGQICDDYALRDGRIKVIHQLNKGRIAARWASVEQSEGNWIAFVDSDDMLPETAIADLYEKADDDTDIILGNGQKLPNEHRVVIPMEEFRHKAVSAEGTIGVPWGSLYRRSVITAYLFDLSRDVISGEDYIFWLRLVFSTNRPVKVVYKNVYTKSEDRTSGYFKWTAAYAQMLNELRISSIPEEQRSKYAADMLHDRIANLFDIAVNESRTGWKHSQFYQDILHDTTLSFKQKLFLSIPSLWVRKRIKEKNSIYYLLFLAVVFFAILGLNLLDVPTLSDDMIYRFMWNMNESDAVHSIDNLNDLLQSQWNHYLTQNGRFVYHLLFQAFTVFTSPILIQLINSILFVVLLCESAYLITNKTESLLFVSIFILFLLFVVFQGFRTTTLWGLGAFNYIWVTVAILSLLLWLRHINNESFSIRHLLLSPLALLAGWSHEAISLPICITFLIYIIINRKELLRKALLPYMIWFIIGSLLVLFPIGTWNRATAGITLNNRLLSGCLNIFFNIRILWILLLTIIIIWRKEKYILIKHFNNNFYYYIALTISFVITVLCGTNLERVAFFTDFIAMLLLMRLILNKLNRRWSKILIIISSILIIICYFPAYLVRKENKYSWLYAEQQMKKLGTEIVSVKYPLKGKNLILDYFRNHYVNPSIDFGYYCSYMGFDYKDVNMRCVAQLYGKDRLIFLPEDIILKIENDSTAYQNYELDEHQLLYVWRIPNYKKKVSKLTFILGKEDTSNLLPHQRLLSYKEDSYELDDFHYEVVRINGCQYLIFTKPTTNIFRRIKEIDYQ